MWTSFSDGVASAVAYLVIESPFHELLVMLVVGYGLVRAIRDGLTLAPGSFSAQVRDLLWFSVLCGLAAFATIEISKRLFNLRAPFQIRATEEWLRIRLARAREALSDGLAAEDPKIRAILQDHDPFKELIEGMGLDSRGDPRDLRRLFGLPAEQLTAQVAAAADVGLTDPLRYPALVAALSGEYDPSVFHLLRDADLPPQQGSPVDEDWTSDQELQRAHGLRSGVDQLQISLSERWRNNIQLAAVWIAGSFGVGITFAAHVSHGGDARYVLAATLLGGVAAWFARDIAAVIERIRQART